MNISTVYATEQNRCVQATTPCILSRLHALLQQLSFRVKDRRYPLTALVESVMQKEAKLRIRGNNFRDQDLEVTGISVYGKEEPTLAERIKSQIILDALRGKNALLSNLGDVDLAETPDLGQSRDIARVIWQGTPPGVPDPEPHPGLEYFSFGMNAKQKLALKVMLASPASDSPSTALLPVVIGPPGSGKTTVISAFARAVAYFGGPVWLISQSNVAVKNIAERLIRDDFPGFRMLISKDFIEGW